MNELFNFLSYWVLDATKTMIENADNIDSDNRLQVRQCSTITPTSGDTDLSDSFHLAANSSRTLLMPHAPFLHARSTLETMENDANTAKTAMRELEGRTVEKSQRASQRCRQIP